MKLYLTTILLCLGFLSNAQIVNIESYRLVGDTNKLIGNVDVIMSMNKNQKTIFQFGLNSNIEYNYHIKHNLMLITTYNWIKTVDKGVTDNFLNDGFQHLRYNYTLSNKLKLESFIQYQYNKIMNLKERDLIGLGCRYKLTEDKVNTYLGMAIMYEHNILNDLLQTNVNYMKLNNYITINSKIGHFRISNTTYFQYNINNSKYRVYSILESTINIYKKIYYKINFVLQYDNDQVFNVPLFIYSTNNRISISF